MVIGEAYKGCRYWGYETLSTDVARTTMNTPEVKAAAREQYKAERLVIKAEGFKAGDMGLSKLVATNRAKLIEDKTGIAMHVFNHDYL